MMYKKTEMKGMLKRAAALFMAVTVLVCGIRVYDAKAATDVTVSGMTIDTNIANTLDTSGTTVYFDVNLPDTVDWSSVGYYHLTEEGYGYYAQIAQMISINGESLAQINTENAENYSYPAGFWPHAYIGAANKAMIIENLDTSGQESNMFRVKMHKDYFETLNNQFTLSFNSDSSLTLDDGTVYTFEAATWEYDNGTWTKVLPIVDVTDYVTMGDIGTAISSDTTTITISLGGYDVTPADIKAGYFINDNSDKNGIDPASYVAVNGVTVREHIEQYSKSGPWGNGFPMYAGYPYNPILMYCDAGSGFFRISILDSYLAQGVFNVTLKAGFTWNNASGEQLKVTKDITYCYTDGIFGKKPEFENVSGFSVEGYAETPNGSGESVDEFMQISLVMPSEMKIYGEDGNRIIDTYTLIDNGNYNSIFDAISLNGQPISEINAEYPFSAADFKTFPYNISDTYANAVNPLVVRNQSGQDVIALNIRKDIAELLLGDAPVLTVNAGRFLVVDTDKDGTAEDYRVPAEEEFYYCGGKWVTEVQYLQDENVDAVKKGITISGYCPITNYDFGVSDGTYSSVEGNSNISLHGKIFNADVKMADEAVITYAGLALSKHADSLTLKNGETVIAELASPEDLTGEFNLKISTKIISADKLKVGVWINDKLCNNKYSYVEGYGTTVAKGFAVTGDVTLKAAEQTICTDYYRLATLSDFGIADGSGKATGSYAGEKDGLVFVADVTLGTAGSVTYFGQSLTRLPLEAFNLKVTTDLMDADGDGNKDDVRMGVFVNDVLQNHCYTYLTDTSLENSIKISADAYASAEFEIHLESLAYDSKDGGYLISASGEVKVDGEVKASGDVITALGDYEIRRKEGIVTYVQQISIYELGDPNGDGVKMNSKDIVSAKKCSQKLTDSKMRIKGADFDRDGSVGDFDIKVIREVLVGSRTLEDAIAQYDVAALTYDYLGGETVMPIAGYYAPYRQGYNSTHGFAPDYLSDEIYQLIADSGINLLLWGNNNYSNSVTDETKEVLKAFELAEKYGMGMYANDSAINGKNVSLTEAEFASQIGSYSRYSSYLGQHIADEPGYGLIIGSGSGRGKLENYEKAAQMANTYANDTGFANLYQYKQAFALADYDGYLQEYCKTYNPKQIAFDYYPFSDMSYDKYETDNVKDCTYYFKSLDKVRTAANIYNIPFWSYIGAGGDFRDSEETGESTHKDPTEGEFFWNVNTSLAFGAKGISYFTIIQPYYYSNITESTFDYGRNGLIGANGITTEWYDFAKKANQQIKAIDEVLMRSTSQGVTATGGYALDNVKGLNAYKTIADCGLSGITATDSTYGAMIGWFNYGGKKAFYVVNYNAYGSQNVTLNFNDSCSYRMIDNAEQTTGEGSSCSIDMEAGAGVLIVIE